MAAIVEKELLSDFTANPSPYLDKLLAMREPIRLSANGDRDVVILDAQSYDELLGNLDRAAALAAVAQSQREFKENRGMAFRQVMEELSRKHGLPASSLE